MLVHEGFHIEHKIDAVEDKVILLDNFHMLLFFFKTGKYILYNYISKTIVSQIYLKPQVYSAFYFTPKVFLAILPSSNTILSVDPFTGLSVQQKTYYSYDSIPDIKILSEDHFGLLYHTSANKKMLEIYNAELKFKRRVKCDTVVESFSDSLLATYNQLMAKLRFTLINEEVQESFEFDYNMEQKLLMKVISKDKESRAIFVFKENQVTVFMDCNLKQGEVVQIFRFDERLLNLILYDAKLDLFVSSLWSGWSCCSQKDQTSIAVNKKINNVETWNVKLWNGLLSNVAKDRNYRFCCYKWDRSEQISKVEVYMIPTVKNQMIDILTKGGIVDLYGQLIVRKVLGVVEY